MTRRTPAPEKAQLDSLPSSAITCGRANMMTCSAGVEFSSMFNDTCKHISASCGLNADIFPECIWTILQWLLLVRAWRFFETVIAPNSHPKFAAWYIDSCQILQHVGRHKLWSRFKVIRLDIDGETEFAANRDWNRGAEWRDLWICQLSYGQIWSSGFGWRVLVPLWGPKLLLWLHLGQSLLAHFLIHRGDCLVAMEHTAHSWVWGQPETKREVLESVRTHPHQILVILGYSLYMSVPCLYHVGRVPFLCRWGPSHDFRAHPWCNLSTWGQRLHTRRGAERVERSRFELDKWWKKM